MVGMDLGEHVKPKTCINVGCLFDIPSGTWITGKMGESIINGGLSPINGVVGGGNNFKSTINDYITLKAASIIAEDTKTQIGTYDTEMNISYDRKENLASKHPSLPSPITYGDEAMWFITDKATIPANKWAEKLMVYADKKIASKDDDITVDCLMDPITKKELVIKVPTFIQIDSFTEFEAESGVEMLSKDLDSSDTNTHFMRQGLFKTKFLSQIPRITNSANIYMSLVSHIGEKINMATGPAMYNQPPKDLQHLKNGVKLKGVTGKFFYLTTSCWYAHTASLLKNQSTKLAEYPWDSNDVNAEDLNTVKLTQLRSKTGMSGYTLEIVVSQTDGVNPELTHFNYIKENGRYGIEGSNIHYALSLCPDVSLSRTTVRRKLAEDKKLARACELTADLLQMWIFQQRYESLGLLCTPKELYDDIKALGYDWDVLLATRGYFKLKQYAKGVPYLSILDLLKMRKGLYKPYFLNEDKTPNEKYFAELPTPTTKNKK